MKPAAVAYTPAEHQRLNLGLRPERPESDPTVFRVAITANLVATNAGPLRTMVLDAIHEGRTQIVLDLSQTPDADKRGLETLLSIAKAAKRAGGSLVLQNVQRDVLELLNAHRIADLFGYAPAMGSGQ